MLRLGGTLVSIVPLDGTFPTEEAEAARVRAGFMPVEPDQHALREIGALVEDGRLRMVVEKVFPPQGSGRGPHAGRGRSHHGEDRPLGRPLTARPGRRAATEARRQRSGPALSLSRLLSLLSASPSRRPRRSRVQVWPTRSWPKP